MNRKESRGASGLTWTSAVVVVLLSLSSVLRFQTQTYPRRGTEEQRKALSNETVSTKSLAEDIIDGSYDSTATTIINSTLSSKQRKMAKESSDSPVCHPFANLAVNTNRTIRRIYFAHMRKAGGTTLRSYLRGVAQKLGINFDVTEGGHFEAPGSDPSTLYVTHLRDPFKRSISHFQYEVRWPCSQMLQNESFVPSWENAANITRWITEPDYLHPSLDKQATKMRRCDDTQKYLIDCATNCYIRWMNSPQGACAEQVFERKSVYYYKALQSLRNYDVIIDTGRLFSDDDTGYAADLERWFGQKGIQSKNSPMYCLRPSRNANRNFPLDIDNATCRLFYERNQADYDLYNDLITCHTASNRAVFPVASKNNDRGDNEISLASFVLTVNAAVGKA